MSVKTEALIILEVPGKVLGWRRQWFSEEVDPRAAPPSPLQRNSTMPFNNRGHRRRCKEKERDEDVCSSPSSFIVLLIKLIFFFFRGNMKTVSVTKFTQVEQLFFFSSPLIG